MLGEKKKKLKGNKMSEKNPCSTIIRSKVRPLLLQWLISLTSKTVGVEQEERLQGKGMRDWGHCNWARTHSHQLQLESWRPCRFPGGVKIKYIPGKDLIAQMKSESNQLLAIKLWRSWIVFRLSIPSVLAKLWSQGLRNPAQGCHRAYSFAGYIAWEGIMLLASRQGFGVNSL